MLEMMSQLMNGQKTSLKQLKKGFVFFLDQEKQQLARMKQKILLRRKLIGKTGDSKAIEWWAEEDLFRPISEYTLQKNEYLDVSKDVQDAPYAPKLVNNDLNEPSQEVTETIMTPGAMA